MPDLRSVDLTQVRGFNLGGFCLRPFAGDEIMVVRVEGPPGALAPEHSHPHEQLSTILQGRVRFRLGDEVVELSAGEALHIPSGAPHEAFVLEETVFFDIFHPVREEFLDRQVP
ncbi:MAG: cupin domain-containing protein [Actinomycetota bacterium]|nr:cupin domain-containing protein [Actinomycetota bacterium]MDA8077293.1 cupin domain-containing protein [Actinomycetota bacterium]